MAQLSEPVISTTQSNKNTEKRSKDFFDGCIIIDDDDDDQQKSNNETSNVDNDIQEVEQKQ